MISYMFSIYSTPLFLAIAIIGTFLITFCGIKLFKGRLPKDQGREFALNGMLSEGKPRGAGIILIISLLISVILFVRIDTELLIYLGLILLEMLSGYLDDSAKVPWGRLKKGLIDLVVSFGISLTFCIFNGNKIMLATFDIIRIEVPVVLFIILGAALVWGSINVTNCSDGVDGLCTSMSLITLLTTYILINFLSTYDNKFGFVIILVIMVLLAYLWFNASPSKLLMGDAGSRALGVIIALAFLKTGAPIAFLLGGFMLILDGGLSLFKITVIKITKRKNFMQNIRTPIHDHMRKNKGWSDTQVVARFTIIQIVISLGLIALAFEGYLID